MSEFLIVTGLSGAGGSTAASVFEDLGWFVIDNLPPALIGKVADLARRPDVPQQETERICLVVWASPFLEELLPALDQLERKRNTTKVRVLFLEANDDVLIRRFEDKRRRHPVDAEGGVADAIARERALLQPVKERADVVVDTSDLNVHQLRDRLTELFSSEEEQQQAMQTSVVSFGYKHGIPLDVDTVIDCRFLPNPHWVDELRPQTGLDEPVKDYVLGQPETSDFLDRLGALLDLLLPAYVKEGKSYFTIAVGCTGGNHRSVVLAQEVARLMQERGFNPAVHHRDVERR
ncbi:MAG TPA: RNase adapter RapZ [Acidimicrobiales bacterium]|jgi:RNase adapter protein RapZ|nr:RNase adapter RapZ [Acidimicrobiales bacterium]